jgi:DNA-binding NtrC family response regulator
MAEGGTLFLDEIDALSLAAQGKLLRFLQERTFRPLGADRFLSANLNVISATNRDLEAVVREQRFRADLFYRLNVLRLHLPALRERRTDIGILAAHFLKEACAATKSGPRSLSPAAIQALLQHDWPGNVRELANVVHRAVVAAEGHLVLPCHIALTQDAQRGAHSYVGFQHARAAAVAAFERHYVEDLLRKHGGNVTRAAQDARKERRAFGRLIKKYGIQRAAR